MKIKEKIRASIKVYLDFLTFLPRKNSENDFLVRRLFLKRFFSSIYGIAFSISVRLTLSRLYKNMTTSRSINHIT